MVHGIIMKTTSAEHGLHMFCACDFHGNSMNNLLTYCGLVDARISVSEKDLPVITHLLVHSFPLWLVWGRN